VARPRRTESWPSRLWAAPASLPAQGGDLRPQAGQLVRISDAAAVRHVLDGRSVAAAHAAQEHEHDDRADERDQECVGNADVSRSMVLSSQDPAR
jgi:hypothetical protein